MTERRSFRLKEVAILANIKIVAAHSNSRI
jgi:hypothetical protein